MFAVWQGMMSNMDGSARGNTYIKIQDKVAVESCLTRWDALPLSLSFIHPSIILWILLEETWKHILTFTKYLPEHVSLCYLDQESHLTSSLFNNIRPANLINSSYFQNVSPDLVGTF